MDNLKVLKDLHPCEYEHPFDTKALDALQNTPGLDTVVRLLSKHYIERMIIIQYTGSNLHITEDSYPKIHALLDDVCGVLNLPARPDMYLEWKYQINAFTIGVDHPIVVLASGAIDLLTDSELFYIIGHEVGHIKSRHTLYHTMADYFSFIATVIGEATLGLGKLLASPLQSALLWWRRMSEFTADRAGLLACQDPNVAATTMMKIAGMPIKHYDDLKSEKFIEQARRFQELDYDSLNKLAKIYITAQQTHPWAVMRCAELQKWIESGEYLNVIDRKTSERIPPEATSQFCTRCSCKLEGSEKFCSSCGAPVKKGPLNTGISQFCKKCSCRLRGSEKFCFSCGTPVEAKSNNDSVEIKEA
jgi:Zn-dependent protease with chaperone function